jgi:putative mRNA 3-end processing factor
MKLLEFNNRGIFCEKAGVYIDPWKPVDTAIITHGHSDHARWGCNTYICHHHTKPVLKWRLGNETRVESVDYHEKFKINGAVFSLHPAGHIIGSAQVRAEYKGEVWVVSGDYKLENDGLSEPFEPVRCNIFVTESTFGLPIYKWKPQHLVYSEILQWWEQNRRDGLVSVLNGYSLGKAQRLLNNVDGGIGPIFIHGAISNINQALIAAGIPFPEFPRVTPETKKRGVSGSADHRPSVGIEFPLDEKVFSLFNGDSLGMDEPERNTQTPICRPRIYHFRPRRLGRPEFGDKGNRG